MAFQDYLRRVNLFSNPTPRPSFKFQFPDMQPDNVDDNTPISKQRKPLDMSEMYKSIMDQEAGPAQQRYSKFLDEETPNRENFKPSKMNRLAAMLTGISEGISHGAGSGARTAREMLDEPFQGAMDEYKLKADKFAKGAELEERNVGNRVKTLWDTLRYNQELNREEANAPLRDAQTKYYAGRANELGKPKLLNSFTDTGSGTRRGVFSSSTSPKGFDILDLGKAGPSTQEQIDLAGKKAGAASNATLPGRLEVVREGAKQRRITQSEKFSSIEKLNEWKKNNQHMVPFKQPGGNLMFIDPNDPYNPIDTGIESGKYTDKQIEDLRQRHRIDLKTTPAPSTKKTTTTTIEGNKKVSTSETSGSAPTGKKVRMIDPNGQPWEIDESEVDEAISHGYKKG